MSSVREDFPFAGVPGLVCVEDDGGPPSTKRARTREPTRCAKPSAAVLRAKPVRVTGRYTVAPPDDASRDALMRALTLKIKVSASVVLGEEEEAPVLTPFEVDEDGGVVHVPRFYGLQTWGPPPEDARVMGAPLTHASNIELCDGRDGKPPQTEACAAVLAQLRGPLGGAMLVLPCGFGKTVCAIYCAAALARKFVVIVHDNGLKEQWVQRLNRFLPGATVGIIQGKPKPPPKRKPKKPRAPTWREADVCVAMIQSLCGIAYEPEMYEAFGTVIVDEAHHVAAAWFSRALPKFPARYVLGLSATPDRSDGLTPALTWLMGPTAYRATREAINVDVRLVRYHGGSRREIKYKNGTTGSSTMTTNIMRDATRNGVLMRETLAAVERGRRVIVLTGREEH